ncbi:MAG: hypothetical protein A3F72_19425 [Bacteroidetes bacterium RIFCSPLOWO2_12_FULL_35_15]|nr:MAG: hypothetical protein A3F72_19425 [Bacteroidetes bacterium RIFCSPLOWO2_12_FULL_35_15]
MNALSKMKKKLLIGSAILLLTLTSIARLPVNRNNLESFIGVTTFQVNTKNITIDSLLAASSEKKDKEDTNKVIRLNKLCLKYKNIGNYDTAFYYGNFALQLAKQLNYSKGIADSYNNIGNMYFNQGNYDKSLENHFASLKIREEINDKQSIASSFNNIGSIYVVQNKYDKAMVHYSMALKIYEELKDKSGMSTQLGNIGVIYFYQNNFRQALEYYSKALKIEDELGNKIRTARLLGNIGLINFKQGNYHKVLKNYFKALAIFKAASSKYDITISYNNIGSAYKKLKQPLLAIEFYSKALVLAKEIGSKEDIKEAYQNLSEIYANMEDYKNAYEYYQDYSKIKDSIFSEKSDRDIMELQIKYETERKEKEIKLLDNENKIKTLQISEQQQQLFNNRILLGSLLAGIILIIVISRLLISRNRIRQKEILKTELLKQQEQRTKIIIETQEQERKRIAQDLHDGIGQTLAGIKINLTNITNKTNFISEEYQKNVHQTIKSLDDAYKEVRALSHFMMPKSLKESGLADAIDDLLDKTLKSSTIKYIFEKDNTIRVEENTEIGLYRVFQELLNNILKHANASEIIVHLHKTNRQIVLMVEDNGIGINQSNKKTGIGLSNMETRVHTLNGTFVISAGAHRGTLAVVRIPVIQQFYEIKYESTNKEKLKQVNY